MATLNFKHLRYFWMVAKTGSIAQAAQQLHLTPQSISGQLTEFADSLGVELLRRAGRKSAGNANGGHVPVHPRRAFIHVACRPAVGFDL